MRIRNLSWLAALAVLFPGAARAQWPHARDGSVPLRVAPGTQYLWTATSDGFGGAFFVWSEPSGQLRAQRLDGQGGTRWGSDGNEVSAGVVHQATATADWAGGLIVAWSEVGPNGSIIRAQRFAANGTALWSSGPGIVVSGAPGGKDWPTLATDGTDRIFVAWNDTRSGSREAYVIGLDHDGDIVWDERSLGAGRDARLLSDGSGGAMVTRIHCAGEQGDCRLIATRIHSDLSPAWSPADVVVRQGEAINEHAVTPDGTGGAIVTWTEQPTLDRDEEVVFLQRLSATGTLAWDPRGVRPNLMPPRQRFPRALADGAGGAIVIWNQGDAAQVPDGVYAQRLDPSGLPLWVPTRVAGGSEAPCLASDGMGGALLVWSEFRGSGQEVLAQRLGADGSLAWGAAGIRVSVTVENQWRPVAAVDGEGAVIAWHDARNGGDLSDLYAQRLTWLGLPGRSGDNLVDNVGFEDGLAGWDPYQGSRLSIAYGGREIGGRVLQLGGPASLGEFGINDHPNWIWSAPMAGTRFRFEAWVAAPGNLGRCRLRVREYLDKVRVGGSNYSPRVALSREWQRVTLDYVTQKPGSSLDLQILVEPLSPGISVQVDDVSIRALEVVAPGTAGLALPSSLEGDSGAPGADRFALGPQPAGDRATLHLTLSRAGAVSLRIFDITGREVARPFHRSSLSAGEHGVVIDTRRWAPGVYLCRLELADRVLRARLVHY